MKVTFTCINCNAKVTETVKRAIEAEFIKVSGACCAACCRYAYSK